jgi:predicted transcriptional regulator
MGADLEAVLDSLRETDGNEGALDEVTVSLLVAAKNDVLLYDISKWGEDIGLASKATFSRTKTELEDVGLIETEKVPIDVGRPRLRLRLGDDRLLEADADQLAAVARDILG